MRAYMSEIDGERDFGPECEPEQCDHERPSSDPNEPGLCSHCCPGGTDCDCDELRQAAAAVAEARHILADVEPDGPQTACFGIERIAARNCAPNAWTSALADALAAFVAD